MRQREERYKSVLLTAPDIIITIDRDLKITDINHPIHPDIDSVGKNLFEFIDPDFHARVEEELERVFTLGVNGHYELVGQGVDGNPSWYETNIGPIFENGSVTSAVLVIRVITERKMAEIALKESEERFRSLSENAFEGIGINIDGLVVDANNALSDILGWGPMSCWE